LFEFGLHFVVVRGKPKSTTARKKFSPNSGGQFGQSPLEKPPLRRLLGEGEGAQIRGPCLRCPVQAPAQVRACGVRQVIVRGIAARQDGVGQREARLGSVAHGNRGGAGG